MESWNHYDGVTAIEGLEETLAEDGIVGDGGISRGGIEVGIMVNHIRGHVVGPFKDLGANVGKEGIRRPTAEDHDFGHGVVHEEEGHGCTGPNGFVANIWRGKTKVFFTPIELADVPEEMPDEGVSDKKWLQ